jgi:hypothetical protein
VRRFNRMASWFAPAATRVNPVDAGADAVEQERIKPITLATHLLDASESSVR